jgi:hypothetical protein
MSTLLRFETSTPAELTRRKRLVLAILASLVLLVALAVVEVGAVAAIGLIAHTHPAVTK